MEKEIIIARHAQTDINIGGHILGKTDIPLNETGVHEVERLVKSLQSLHIKPEVILTSPLKRAKQTASLIADGMGGIVEVTDVLREIDYGHHEGKDKTTYKDIEYGYKSAAMRAAVAETVEDREAVLKTLLEETFQ